MEWNVRRAGALVFVRVAALVTFLVCQSGAPQAAEMTKSLTVGTWNETLEAGKKEGQVNVYINGWGAILDSGVFQKAYPEIKVVGVAGMGAQVSQRMLAERRAGKSLADVYIDGVPYPYPTFYEAKLLEPVKPALLLPEVLDESKWWQGRHRYPDPEKSHVFTFAGMPLGLAYYNSKLVNPKEFKSLWDLVQPRWKGKIEIRDIRIPGPGSGAVRFFYYHPELGSKFVRRLFGEMDATLFRDFRQGTDWLSSGKFAICFFCSDIDKTKAQGLPVDSFGPSWWKEGTGLVSHNGSVTLLNRAPHPNAAKVFLNWLLSREGQLTLQRSVARARGSGPNSLRIDIPKDDVAVDNRLVEGVPYMELDSRQEWLNWDPILKVIETALADSAKK